MESSRTDRSGTRQREGGQQIISTFSSSISQAHDDIIDSIESESFLRSRSKFGDDGTITTSAVCRRRRDAVRRRDPALHASCARTAPQTNVSERRAKYGAMGARGCGVPRARRCALQSASFERLLVVRRKSRSFFPRRVIAPFRSPGEAPTTPPSARATRLCRAHRYTDHNVPIRDCSDRRTSHGARKHSTINVEER